MDYPRELNLDAETETALIAYLEYEIINHEAERTTRIEDLKRWQRDYWAKPSSEQRKFPFLGAANIIIPLTAITLEAVHARTMMTLFGLPQFVTCKMAPPYDDLSNPLENCLDFECLKAIDIYKPADNFILETEKFGTGIMKTGWAKRVRTAVKTVGGQDEEFEVTVKQGPTVDAVTNANFFMPFTNQDPQESRLVGEYHNRTLEEVNRFEQDGLFKKGTYDKIKNYYTQYYQAGADDYRREIEKLQSETPVYPKFIQWYELWMAFDTDKSDKLKEIVVHYHRPSRTFMSIRYNWYDDLHRPYRHANYFPLEHRWNGVGIAKQLDQFQKEITIQHRQRLDSGTLANARMLKVKKMSGYGPGEPFFPGKIWMVDDMADVESFQLGDLPTSAFSNENSTLMFAQQRSGINDLNLGMPQAGTPGTATSDLARVQEGSRKFDYSYRNIKRAMDAVVVDVACNIAQFGLSNSRYLDLQPSGPALKEFFAQPVMDIRQQLVAAISTAGANGNKLIDRQNWTQISQIINSYYTQIIQLGMQTQNQALLGVAIPQALSGANEALKQILESFDVRNIEKILINMPKNAPPPQVPPPKGAKPNSMIPQNGPPAISPT